MRALFALAVLSLAAGCVAPDAEVPAEAYPSAPVAAPAATSAYAGQEAREIKALSADEIEGYRKGAGLGYAKPAELNSYPGPLHALEMAVALGLTQAQIDAITAIRQAMLDKVVPLGEQYLVVEGQIEQVFRDDAMTPETLAALLDESARIEAKIRFVHLDAHIATKALLTPHQIALYDDARGYGKADHNAHEHG